MGGKQESSSQHLSLGDAALEHWRPHVDCWAASPLQLGSPYATFPHQHHQPHVCCPALSHPHAAKPLPCRSHDEQPLGADACGAASVRAQSARAHQAALTCVPLRPDLATPSLGRWGLGGTGGELYQDSRQGVYVLPVQASPALPSYALGLLSCAVLVRAAGGRATACVPANSSSTTAAAASWRCCDCRGLLDPATASCPALLQYSDSLASGELLICGWMGHTFMCGEGVVSVPFVSWHACSAVRCMKLCEVPCRVLSVGSTWLQALPFAGCRWELMAELDHSDQVGVLCFALAGAKYSMAPAGEGCSSQALTGGSTLQLARAGGSS